MTNKVAKHLIESLDYYLQQRFENYAEQYHEAMMLAINALDKCEVINDAIKLLESR